MATANVNPIRKLFVGQGVSWNQQWKTSRPVAVRRWGYVCPECGRREVCKSWPTRNVSSRKVAKDLLHAHMKEAHAAL